MIKFLLIFLSSCTFGKYDCVHEIMTFETYHECAAAQENFEGYNTLCAMVVEGSKREFNIQAIGEPQNVLLEKE